MAVKVALVLLVFALVLVAAVIVTYRYFDKRAEERHEKEMHRAKRNTELLNSDTDEIDRELERERQTNE